MGGGNRCRRRNPRPPSTPNPSLRRRGEGNATSRHPLRRSVLCCWHETGQLDHCRVCRTSACSGGHRAKLRNEILLPRNDELCGRTLSLEGMRLDPPRWGWRWLALRKPVWRRWKSKYGEIRQKEICCRTADCNWADRIYLQRKADLQTNVQLRRSNILPP